MRDGKFESLLSIHLSCTFRFAGTKIRMSKVLLVWSCFVLFVSTSVLAQSGEFDDNSSDVALSEPEQDQDPTIEFLEAKAKELEALIDDEVTHLLPLNDEELRDEVAQEIFEDDATPPKKAYKYRDLTSEEIKKSSADKMYWIDRSQLSLASAPTIEMGVWHAAAKTYEVVKSKFTTKFMDWSKSRVIDRRIIQRVKKVAQKGCKWLPSENGFEDNAKVEPEQMAVARNAEALIWAMLKVYPVRFYFGVDASAPAVLEDYTKSTLKRHFDSVQVITQPRCDVRFKTIQNINVPRQFEWGSMNYYDVLESGLAELDRYDPFDLALIPLLRQFRPNTGLRKAGEIRDWTVADPSGFDEVTDLIAKCMVHAL